MSMQTSILVRQGSLDGPSILGGGSQSAMIRQSASVFFAQVALLLCGVLNSFLVAHLVGPEGRGLIYLLQFIAGGVGLILLNFGLGPASVFYLGRELSHPLSEVAAGLLWASLLLGILPIAILGPLWPWTAALFAGKLAAPYFWMAMAVIPAMNLSFNVGFLCLARKRIGTYNCLRLSPSLLFSVSLLGLLFGHFRQVWLVALTWVAATLIAGLFALEVVRRAGGIRWWTGVSKFLRTAFRFGWQSHLGAVTQYLQHRSDVVLVGYFLPLKDLGLYVFGVGLAELLWNVPQAVATVLMPHLAGNPEGETIRITPLMCRATLALTVLLSVGLVVASTWLIPWLLPPFHASVRVLWLLIPGTVTGSILLVLSSDFNGRGKPIETFYPAVIAFGLGLASGILVIPRFGINGAAVVTTCGYVLNASLYVRAYSKMTAVTISNLLFIQSSDLSIARRLLQEWKARAEN